MQSVLAPTLVALPSRFDAIYDEEPRSLVFQQQRQLQRSATLWGLKDETIQRFLNPAPNASQDELAAHISSATTAYAKAFLSMQKSAKDAKLDAQLDKISERDLADLAHDLYGRESAMRRGHVTKFVGVLHHYHGVFDVLSQADFSGLPLIWGGMKLILMMAKNRSDLLDKVTDSLFEIGMSLSRIEIYTKLFPTARMMELTSRLYAAVVDFLQDVVAHFQQNRMRQMLSSLTQPFEEKFGYLMDRVNRLGNSVQQDVLVLQVLQAVSVAHHHVDSFLQRRQMETTLNAIPQDQVPDMFLRIKDTLFHGFEHQASFHENLSAMYGVTAGAWKPWFGIEQRYLPSSLGPTTRFVQGLCDAPDNQHALQWVAQQRTQSPHIPSAYLIWARGMTIQSAISSLVFQIIRQKPEVISRENLDMSMFLRANASIKALWDVFVHLMRVLGGCLIYIAMGSAGPDEFALVEKFIKTVNNWDGPTIRVTIIHPNHPGFVMTPDVCDLDGIYDVHPSLTTTDAIHHVLMLELNMHNAASETIRTAFWEPMWREVRYAVIGIALTQVTEAVRAEAETLGRQRVEQQGLDEIRFKLWLSGVGKWAKHRAASNNVREQIQKHLYMVDLKMPAEIERPLAQRLKLMVFSADADCIAGRCLTQTERDSIWAQIQVAIIPSTVEMFCGSVGEFVGEALDEYCSAPIRNQRQAGLAVVRMLDDRFGGKQNDNGGEEDNRIECEEDACSTEDSSSSAEREWKETFTKDSQLIMDGIVEGIVVGFEQIIAALSQPERREEVEKIDREPAKL